ncbi:MAG: FAD binding domain-containing protein [Pseudomonadota bacterium]
MKAPDFEYERPDTLAAALTLLADDSRDVQVLAGGQSLIPMMNFRMAAPEVLLDLGGLDLGGIGVREGMLEIGAMTRYVEMMRSDLVAQHAPLITLALPHVAHAAIRNRGTLGGSVALADPEAEMPAVLLALDAQIVVTGLDGPRTLPAPAFFLGLYETALEPDEIVTAIQIPTPPRRIGFAEVARRHGDYAMAGVAVTDRGTGATLTDPRVAFFGVADRPLRAQAVEEALEGASFSKPDALAALSDIPFEGDLNASPDMKRHLAGVVLGRAYADLIA